MQTNTDSYTVIFALVMTVVVAIGLSFTATGLKPMQDKNVEIANKKEILNSIGMSQASDIEATYSEVIHEYVVNFLGEEIEADANGNPLIASKIDVRKESRKPLEERYLPLYGFTDNEGKSGYIIPLRGAGLWDEIWGYIALEDDYKTVYGASFDHKSETPGLGAEIATPPFQKQFIGKTIIDDSGTFTSIEVVKGIQSHPSYQVDGISGGTITSNGVSEMLYSDIKDYLPFFERIKNENL